MVNVNKTTTTKQQVEDVVVKLQEAETVLEKVVEAISGPEQQVIKGYKGSINYVKRQLDAMSKVTKFKDAA